MTRQKKELVKKIEQIRNAINEDYAYARHFGFEPPDDAYDKAEEELYALENELARLSHYRNATEMQDEWMAYFLGLPDPFQRRRAMK